MTTSIFCTTSWWYCSSLVPFIGHSIRMWTCPTNYSINDGISGPLLFFEPTRQTCTHWLTDLHGKFIDSISSPHWMGMRIHKSRNDALSTHIEYAFKRRFCISVFDLRVATQIRNVSLAEDEKRKSGLTKHMLFYLKGKHIFKGAQPRPPGRQAASGTEAWKMALNSKIVAEYSTESGLL